MPSPPPNPTGSTPAATSDGGAPRDPAADPIERGLSDLARLVAECLERVDTEGPAAVDEVCEQHPEHADELRRRLAGLRDLGLLNQGQIGPYKLLKTLGQGGMGLVYLALDERLERLVALKALPSRLTLNPRALKRFEREVRAAAQLRHPRLVPIHDVGEADGVPYFTMQYVEGRTLAEAIAALRRLGKAPAELRPEDLARAVRLEDGAAAAAVPPTWGASHVAATCALALDVAEALDCAHEHGIIHRDVKPSNVLVREDGRAQLFDFGLARVESDASLTATSDFTGTPGYVSPEQVGGSTRSLDRRTDVYSLGVTLYELLTLARPFDGRTTQEVFRQILTREPELPRRLNPAIPRDLETVVLTAMEKDPGRRYQSAAELAADLRRFLSFQPVVARPVGRVTRWARTARRHRAASAAVLLGVAILIGTPLGLWRANTAIRAERDRVAGALDETQQARDEAEAARAEADAARAESERLARLEAGARAAAETSAAEAEAAAEEARHMYRRAFHINQVLLDMFEAPAAHLGGAEVTVAQVLDTAADTLADRLADDPIIEASVRNGLGLAYSNLGLYVKAEEQWLRARELCEALGDEADPEVLGDAFANLGVSGNRSGAVPEAGQMLTAALEIYRGLFEGAHEKTASVLNNLSYVHIQRGDFAGALALLEESLAMRRELTGDAGRPVIESMINISFLARRTGDRARSESLMDEALALARHHLAADDPLTATILRNRGLDLGMQAADLGARAGQLEADAAGDPAAAAEAAALREQALAFREQGESMLREALDLLQSSLGPGHRTVAEVRIGLALMLRELDDDAGVVEQLQPAVETLGALEPAGSVHMATALHRLGEAQFALGDAARAEPRLWQALEMLRRFKPDTDRSLLELGNTLTELLQDQQRFDEAEALLLTYQPDFEAAGPARDTYMASLWDSLADVARAAGWSDRQADYEARRDALSGPSTP